MSKVMVIVVTETDDYGRTRNIISHGVNMDTGRDVIMQCVDVNSVDYVYYDKDVGEYFLK